MNMSARLVPAKSDTSVGNLRAAYCSRRGNLCGGNSADDNLPVDVMSKSCGNLFPVLVARKRIPVP
jgi:hypothetical protein